MPHFGWALHVSYIEKHVQYYRQLSYYPVQVFRRTPQHNGVVIHVCNAALLFCGVLGLVHAQAVDEVKGVVRG